MQLCSLHYYTCQGLSWPVSLFGCFPEHPRSTTRSPFPASYFQMFSLAISRLVVSDPQSLSPSPAFLPRLSAVSFSLPSSVNWWLTILWKMLGVSLALQSGFISSNVTGYKYWVFRPVIWYSREERIQEHSTHWRNKRYVCVYPGRKTLLPKIVARAYDRL